MAQEPEENVIINSRGCVTEYGLKSIRKKKAGGVGFA
jgi:hypothetical protein